LVDPPALHRNGPGWTWRVRIPPTYFNLWILLEGSVTMTLRGRSFTCDKPAYFLFPPGEPVHGQSAHQQSPLNFTLHIAGEALSPSLRGGRGEAGWGREVRNPEELRQWAEAAVRHSARGGETGAELALALARAIFLRFWSDATTPPPDSRLERLHSVAEHMASEPGRAWEIDSVARSLGLSAGRFTQAFRKLHGVPPKAYLSNRRMERARRLLAESDAPVGEIAAELGYADLFFFSRHFKRHVGVSPLAWRRSASPEK
jgi:AraC-like DNA-binding protein